MPAPSQKARERAAEILQSPHIGLIDDTAVRLDSFTLELREALREAMATKYPSKEQMDQWAVVLDEHTPRRDR